MSLPTFKGGSCDQEMTGSPLLFDSEEELGRNSGAGWSMGLHFKEVAEFHGSSPSLVQKQNRGRGGER